MKILRKIFSMPQYLAGCEADTNGDSIVLRILLIKRVENKIFIVGCAKGSMDDVTKFLSDKKRIGTVVIFYSGKAVLKKRIAQADPMTDVQMLQSVLPNAKYADFFLQSQETGDDTNVFIMRKSVIEESVAAFSAAGLYASGVLFNEQLLQEGRELPESISEEYRIAFCTAILSLSPSGKKHLISLHGGEEIYRLKRKNRQLLRYAAFFSLTVLLLNFIVFMLLNEQVSRLSEVAAEMKLKIAGIETIKNKIELKKKILQSTGLSNASRTTYFVDRIINTVPEMINLQELNFQPLKIVDENQEEKWTFRNDYILVNGNSSDEVVLNSWLNELHKDSVFREINLVSYSVDDVSNKGDFKLEITI